MGTSCYCPDPSHPPHASSFHTPRPRGHLTHSFHNDIHKSLFSAQVFRICSQAQHGPPLMKNDLVQNANNSGNPVEMQRHQPSLSLLPRSSSFLHRRRRSTLSPWGSRVCSSLYHGSLSVSPQASGGQAICLLLISLEHGARSQGVMCKEKRVSLTLARKHYCVENNTTAAATTLITNSQHLLSALQLVAFHI